MVMAKSKMTHLLHILADDSRVSVTVWAKYLGPSERSYLGLSENAIDC